LEFIRKGITANGNNRISTIAYPHLNHMFQTAEKGLPVEYSDIEETIAPQVMQDMVNWLKGF
ncbi:MAG: alpha/beta hydrolase, partial [Odoribacter sp.]|nr:alpha/beta hydrolase [Odoribacter sp.]